LVTSRAKEEHLEHSAFKGHTVLALSQELFRPDAPQGLELECGMTRPAMRTVFIRSGPGGQST